MEHKVRIRIIGPVGCGKSEVYVQLVKALAMTNARVVHQDPKAWDLIAQTTGRADSNEEQFNPEVTIEEVCIRTDVKASQNPIMQFFAYAHLPPHLQGVSREIALLAQEMDQRLPQGPEKSAGLRKLLEAKDCLVRSLVRE